MKKTSQRKLINKTKHSESRNVIKTSINTMEKKLNKKKFIKFCP